MSEQGAKLSGAWESYKRHDEVAILLGHMDPAELIKKIKAGAFGRVHKEGRYYFVSHSGFEAYCRARDVFEPSGELKTIYARTPGELRRLVAQQPHDVAA
jgi:hypothetical protein